MLPVSIVKTIQLIESRKYSLFFKQLSIQKRLPVFTCILLLFVVTTYSLTSYIGVRKTALLVGRERLQSLTRQLGSMLEQSTQGLISATRSAARQESIKKYLSSNDTVSDTAVLSELKKFDRDTATVFVALLRPDRKIVLGTGKANIGDYVNIDTTWETFAAGHDTATIGKIYAWKGSTYYPIIASVTDQNRIIGYMIRWRLLSTTPKALTQLTQLIGSDAALFFGNTDGSLWTDMVHTVSGPPAASLKNGTIIEYGKPKGEKVLAAGQELFNTHWIILVEFPKQKLTEAANRFLYWDILIGLILLVAGIVTTWFMSRSITRPLNQLTTATSAIAAGNYPWRVEVNREDELGILARAFNAMAMQVHHVQEDLEKKVQERTTQLESTNKELEAFSYSVSHDLRAPLRVISGYAAILKEEYNPQLDAEAKRLIDVIMANTKMMGQLIDDLIAFSMMGRKKINYHRVDMKLLAETCFKEVLESDETISCQVFIGNLPACYGDGNLLKQVWVNLISNAVKFSSKQPDPKIEIDFREEPFLNIYLIRDNGIGFDMRYITSLFSVFQRLHSRAEYEGTGIGLALVKRVVNKHNGKVWAESTPGEGAVFYFSIPKNTA